MDLSAPLHSTVHSVNTKSKYSLCKKKKPHILRNTYTKMASKPSTENRIPKRVLYMNLGTRLRGRPRNRWQDEVREDGRIVGGEGWQEKVHNRDERKKLLRTARNR